MITPLQLSAVELAAWREQPLTAAFLKWLDESIDVYRRNIPKYVVAGKMDDARAASGALEGYEEIRAALLEEPPREKEPEEDTFVDPATRPTLLTELKGMP